MKRYFFICGLALFLGCREKPRPVAGEIPSFDILLSDSLTHIDLGKIKPGTPVALLYFSPDCEHCQKETIDIIQHMDSLQQVRFYFITNDSVDRIRVFRNVYHLGKYTNISLGWDNQFLFPRHFNGAYPPYLVLYDRHLRQLGSFEGEVGAGKMIHLINNSK